MYEPQDPNYNPYAAPTASVGDVYGQTAYASDSVLLATRGSRLAAVLIDGLVAIAIMLPFFVLMALVGSDETMFLVVAGLMMFALLGLGIYNLTLLHKSGQTIGKRQMNIKIVRSDLYTPATLSRIVFLRYMAMGLITSIPFIGSFISLANYLWIFGAEQRCLHDLLADTHVIQANSENHFADQAAAAYQNYNGSPGQSPTNW